MKKYIYIISLLLIFSSCGSTGKKTLTFKKSDYGKKWPFSVDEIEVYCEGYKELYFKASDGKIYALNGLAISMSKGKPDIHSTDEIRLIDPENSATRITIPQEFVDQGLLICEETK